MKYLPRVLPYLRPYYKLATASVVLIVMSGLVSLLTPWPLKIIVDNVLEQHPLSPALSRRFGSLASTRISMLMTVVAAGLVITLAQNVMNVLQNYVNTRIDLSIVLDFRSDLFRHAQRLSMTYHDQRRSGMMIYVINNVADAASRLVMTIPPLAQSAIMLVGMFWITYRINHTLALLSLSVVPFLYYSVGYYSKHIQARLLQVKGMEGETLSVIHEAMMMLRVIVAFGREELEHRRYREQGQRALSARVRVTVRQTLFSLAVNMTTAVGTALVLGYGAYTALQGRLTTGQLLVVITYLASIYKPLEAISTTVGSLQDQFTSLQMAFNLLDTDTDIKDVPGAVAIERAKGHIKFEEVNFSYSGRSDTLKDIAFEVQPGQVVALVGPTGAGKTTLISLLPRFYDPTSGRILIDGRDTRRATLKTLREQFSIVLQEPLLFSDTIANNIRYGRLDATREEIVEAAKAANAHDFIMNLPEQYETVIGERGAQVSGGERQRISVARAFLKNSPVLILDEPTSSIDSKTEAIILDALDRLMAGRTTFMVAHRLSTIRHADIILVLNQGQLVQTGTHDELLLSEGLYKQLYDMQTRRARRSLRSVAEADPADPYAAAANE